MYSFAQRSDTSVVDEPLYGHYLRVSGADHPGRDEVLAAMNCDGNEVLRELVERQAASTARLFLKNMAHHFVGIDGTLLEKLTNIFLIRDPREMLPSLVVQVPHAQLADTGLRRQWEMFEELAGSGTTPVVVDSRELLIDPGGVLAVVPGRIEPHEYPVEHAEDVKGAVTNRGSRSRLSRALLRDLPHYLG